MHNDSTQEPGKPGSRRYKTRCYRLGENEHGKPFCSHGVMVRNGIENGVQRYLCPTVTHSEEKRQSGSNYYEKNRDKINERNRNRYHEDPLLRLSQSMRSTLRQARKTYDQATKRAEEMNA